MTTYSLLIKNGYVCTASDFYLADIAVKGDKIVAIAPEIDPALAERVIDAEGGFVTPGGIDAHVHVDEPARPFGNLSDTLQSASKSAIAGGTTTMVAFVSQDSTDPGEESFAKVIKEFQDYGGKDLYSDYGLHMIVSKVDKTLLEKQLENVTDAGVSSVKMYMTYPGLQLRDSDLMTAMYNLRKQGITTMLHAENGDMISWMIDSLEEQGKTSPFYHGVSRPTMFEAEATNRAIVLSQTMDNPVLFVHVSAPEAFKRINEAQTEGLPIYAETCPQYLFLSEDRLQNCTHGDADSFEPAKYICSPPLRTSEADQAAVWLAIRNGTVTIVSSDHAPTMFDGEDGKRAAFKNGHNGEFRWIPNGLPGVETRMPLMFSYGVEDGRISVQKFVEVMCTNPAKLYGMYPRKGAILPGSSDADLVIWYPSGKYTGPATIQNKNLNHNTDYTAFEGFPIKNWPRYTTLKGKVMYQHGKVLEETAGTGDYLKRGPSSLAGPQNKWLNQWRPHYT